MEILIILAVPTALVWLLVFLNQHAKTSANLVPMIALSVVLVGSVFGYSFFHLSGGPIPITLDRLVLGGVVGVLGCFVCAEQSLWAHSTEGILLSSA